MNKLKTFKIKIEFAQDKKKFNKKVFKDSMEYISETILSNIYNLNLWF